MKPAVLLIPAAAFVVLLVWLRIRGAGWRNALTQALALGFTLPLALAYCFALPWPEATEGFFKEAMTRFLIALVVIPQIFVLLPAGLYLWLRFVRSKGTEADVNMPTAIALAVIALFGHVWTWAILSAGPVTA